METKDEIKNTQEAVLKVLDEKNYTRNSDTLLIMETLKELGFVICFDISRLKDMPSFETITRIRRKIQNEEKIFLPTIPEIRDKRKIREEDFKNWSKQSIPIKYFGDSE